MKCAVMPIACHVCNVRITAVFAGFFVVASVAAMPAAGMTLASQGTTDVVIVTPKEPSPSVTRADGELRMFL